MKAGFAQVDITPPAGTHLSGSGMGDRRAMEKALDPLFARAAVFEDDSRRVCLLALDLCIVTEEFTARVRGEAARRFGLLPDAVMVHPLQIHSAPSCGPMMLDQDFPLEITPDTEYLTGSESAYTDLAVEGAVRAIGEAGAACRPARVGCGRGMLDRFAFNRRGLQRTGGVAMPWPVGRKNLPLGPVDLVAMEGPSDPEVGVLCVYGDDGAPLNLLLHHSCHPVCVFANPETYRQASADWPGAWSAALAGLCPPGLSPLVLNGCCGNLNPWDPFEPDFKPDHRRMGQALADLSKKVLATLSPDPDATVDFRQERIALDYRDVPADRLREVERILEESPVPRRRADGSSDVDPDWFLAASTKSIEYCRRRLPRFLYEIQVFRIGQAVIVGLPGEPFVEGQIALKLASPAPFTFVAHLTSHYVGYIPTREACARGGHEAHPLCTYWAKLAPDSLDRIVARTTRLVNDVYTRPAAPAA
ncbi:MAG: hypothetical protein BWZ02_02162 [Lentisphaerae bacterium ADurb.BinA184]|nr:MAG: hypothetical protein BWZ02_02162 [Lentisphaerae bacterium ADurb.BinA184]